MPINEKIKILVTHREVPQNAIDILTYNPDVQVIYCDSLPPKRYEILKKSKGVDGILWATEDLLNAEVLDASGKNLKAISTMSSSLHFVDIPVLKSRKIQLGYTPDIENDCVADVAVALMIAAARRFHEGRKKIETGKWENWRLDWMIGKKIEGTVGFLGFSGLGQAIAKRLQGFDISMILYTSCEKEPGAEDYNAKKVCFHKLCKKSDFIFITSPLTKDIKGIFNASAFNRMQSNCVLVNVANGQIVNNDALYDALKTNKIFAAGIDVTDPEPLAKTDKLLQLPNLVITPHLGSATFRTRHDVAEIAAFNVMLGVGGEPMLSPAYVFPSDDEIEL